MSVTPVTGSGQPGLLLGSFSRRLCSHQLEFELIIQISLSL